MLLIFSPDQPFLLPITMLYFTTVATNAIDDLISFYATCYLYVFAGRFSHRYAQLDWCYSETPSDS